MNKTLPYKILWFTILPVASAFLLGHAQSLDLQFHDTYVVIAYAQIALFFTLFLGVLGWIYWKYQDAPLTPILSITHALSTSLLTIALVVIAILQNTKKQMLSEIAFLILIILFFEQLVLAINLFKANQN